MTITKNQKHLLQHTLGDKSCYRNHYCSTPDSKEFDDLCELVEIGLMHVARWPDWMGGYDTFWATKAGVEKAWEEDI